MMIGKAEQCVLVLAYGGAVNAYDIADELDIPPHRATDRVRRIVDKLCAKGLLHVKKHHGAEYELTAAGNHAAAMVLALGAP